MRNLILATLLLLPSQGCAICILRAAQNGEGDQRTAVVDADAAWSAGETGDSE